MFKIKISEDNKPLFKKNYRDFEDLEGCIDDLEDKFNFRRGKK